MKQGYGVWIDHREARIALPGPGGLQLLRIPSQVDNNTPAAAGEPAVPPYGPQDVFAEDQVYRRVMLRLAAFYNQVSDQVKDAGELLVLGPGEAKHEFCRQLKKSRDLARINCVVEAADRMTDGQVISRVKEFFAGRTPAHNGG